MRTRTGQIALCIVGSRFRRWTCGEKFLRILDRDRLLLAIGQGQDRCDRWSWRRRSLNWNREKIASAIQIVRPPESTVETQPQLHPALLRLSAFHWVLLVLYLNELNHRCRFSKQRLLDLALKREKLSLVRLDKGTVQFVLCIGAALAGSPLALAQQLAPATLGDLSKRTEAMPTPNADKPRSKPSVEISAATPNEKPIPIIDQTPPPQELATPAATVEKNRPRVRRHAFVQPTAPPTTPTSFSAAKTLAIRASLPDYPYQARRAHITGSGVCVMFVDTASGKVTSTVMTQSTGNAILDKITTDTFGRWQFKPGTVSQVQVPITYQ